MAVDANNSVDLQWSSLIMTLPCAVYTDFKINVALLLKVFIFANPKQYENLLMREYLFRNKNDKQ